MTAGVTDRARAVRALLAAWMMAAAGAHAQPPAMPLRANETLQAVHGATDRFRYALDVEDAGPFLLRVEQRGLDLVVTVESPNGATESYNSPLVRDGSEWVLIDRPGRYGVEVRSEEHTGAGGGHAISLRRLPTGVDARELDAWNAMAAGAAANFAGGEAAWARSAEAYDTAAQLWDALGRSRERADALFGAASVRYWQLYEWALAAERAAEAAAVYVTLGEAALAANARHLQGASLVEQALEAGQSATEAGISPESAALFATALQLFEQARAVHEQLGNVYDLGLVVNNIGYTYFSMGELVRARGYYDEAAVLLGGVDEWTFEAYALQNIAVLDAEAGELVSAAAAFARILELLPASKPANRANVLDNLGATQRLLGDTEQALQAFTTALALQRDVHDAPGVGRSLRRIGETYYTLGELELAKQYLEQALPIALETNDGRGQEAALRNLGNVAYLERDYAAALDYHRRALEVAASVLDRGHLQLLVAKDLLALGRGGGCRWRGGRHRLGRAPRRSIQCRRAGRAARGQRDGGGHAPRAGGRDFRRSSHASRAGRGAARLVAGGAGERSLRRGGGVRRRSAGGDRALARARGRPRAARVFRSSAARLLRRANRSLDARRRYRRPRRSGGARG